MERTRRHSECRARTSNTFADADVKKDARNNIKVLARMLGQRYHTWDALPLSIALIQDNASRECKTRC
eukprot:7071751-Lingulodinium_polyedra.AAC.1